jgi:hypothetical protein
VVTKSYLPAFLDPELEKALKEFARVKGTIWPPSSFTTYRALKEEYDRVMRLLPPADEIPRNG